MSEIIPSAKELLKHVLFPHVDLGSDILGMVERLSSDDPTHRYQIASILIFLAGVDKTLNLAFELLYLAGKVDWKWMVPGPKLTPPPGYIECTQGLTKKINKLKAFGVDISNLQDLINIRNAYVHSHYLYIGYGESIDEITPDINLKASGPTLRYLLPPMTNFGVQEIKYYANEIIDLVGSFIDKTDWQKACFRIIEIVDNLPKNPEPEYSLMLNNQGREFEIINTLNKRLIGDGAQILMIK